MSVEQPSENQAAEKPASEMSVEELQALLAKKQAEQQPAETQEEAIDMSYVEMADGKQSLGSPKVEAAAPVTPEEQEKVAEQIAEAEGELKTNLEEMEEAVSHADEAFTKAEEALEADPDAVEPKLVLEKIRDAFDRLNNGMNMIMINGLLLSGGMIGATAGMIMKDQREKYMNSNQYIDDVMRGSTSYDWGSLGEQITTVSTFGSLAAVAATFTLAKIARKFKEKQARSKYFAAQAA